MYFLWYDSSSESASKFAALNKGKKVGPSLGRALEGSSLSTVCFTNLGKPNLLMGVWFKAQAIFCYCPSRLLKCCSLLEWSKLTWKYLSRNPDLNRWNILYALLDHWTMKASSLWRRRMTTYGRVKTNTEKPFDDLSLHTYFVILRTNETLNDVSFLPYVSNKTKQPWSHVNFWTWIL